MTSDRVVAVGAVDDDAVAPVAVASTTGGCKIDVHVADVGAAQVVDGDQVGAAKSVEVDGLDAVGVHRDVGHVAEEPEAVSVRRQVDLFGDARAVEEHRVGAVLALDESLPSPGSQTKVSSPLPNSPTSLPPLPSIGRCRYRPQRLGSRTSGQDVVLPVAAVDRGRNGVGEDAVTLVDAHDIVAVPAVDEDLRDLRAPKAEVGRTVVTDVDLQDRRVAALQAKREPVGPIGSLDRQLAMRELRIVERRLLP